MPRIIAESDDNGHWMAWTEDEPQTAFGGDTPAVAVGRLVESLGLDPTTIETEDASDERLTFTTPSKLACPDCNGTGAYVGLTAVEACRSCGGSGYR